ncbi:MAG: DUF4440 domain-containing protein [Pseudomonadota bacterium]
MNHDLSSVESTLRQYGSACNNGDFETWIALWDENGRQMPPDAPTRVGVAAIGEAMQPVFAAMIIEFKLLSVDEVTVFGDIAVTRCTYSIHVTPKEGGETVAVMANGKALTLFRRQSDHGWKIIYDSFNSNTSLAG